MTEFVDRMGFSKDLFEREFLKLEIDLSFKTYLCEYQKLNFLSILLKSSQKNAQQARNKIKHFYLGELKYLKFLIKKERLRYSQFKAANVKRNKYLESVKSCQSCKGREFTKYLCDQEIEDLIGFEKGLRERKIQKCFEQILKWKKCLEFVNTFAPVLFSFGVFP